jgi:hypothetical protein
MDSASTKGAQKYTGFTFQLRENRQKKIRQGAETRTPESHGGIEDLDS